MKKHLHTLLCLLAGFCLSLSLTACHGSAGTASFVAPETFDDTRQYEITFWAKNDTNKNQTAVYKKAIEDFEKLYPNIRVSMKLYTDYGRIYNDIITNIATDTTPNVAITYPDHIATYLEGQNTVVPLETLMEHEQIGLGADGLKYEGPTKEEIVPEFLEEGVIQDTQYALPYMRSTEVVYINEDYVHELGYEVPDVLTWDWIFEVADKALEKNEDGTYKLNGQKVMVPLIYKSTDNMMIQYLKQKGAPYSTEAGEIELFNDTTKDFLKEIADQAQSGAFSTFKLSGYPANFLNAGQAVFAIDSTAGSTWMGANAPLSDISASARKDFNTVVRPVPQVDVENIEMISQGPSIALFNKSDPQEVMAAWLFAQYLLSNDVQLGYAQTEGYLPVTTKALESEAYQDYLSQKGTDEEHYGVKIDATEVLLDNTENTFTTPVFNGSASLRNAAGELVESTVKSVRRHENIDDAYFDKLFSKTSSLYHLDQVNAVGASQQNLGPLPTSSKTLLWTLGIVWVLILAYVLYDKLKKRRRAS